LATLSPVNGLVPGVACQAGSGAAGAMVAAVSPVLGGVGETVGMRVALAVACAVAVICRVVVGVGVAVAWGVAVRRGVAVAAACAVVAAIATGDGKASRTTSLAAGVA
jgi:hypothetical protein